MGSNKTYVANAYRQTIWAYLHSSRTEFKRVKVNVRGEIEVEFEQNSQPDQIGFVESGRNNDPPFNRNNDMDYITVCTNQHSPQCIALPKNRSVLVKPDGTIGLSYYRTMFQSGESDVWKDHRGNDYSQYRK